jgi:type I restriction-modification system DNA methylase subunit
MRIARWAFTAFLITPLIAPLAAFSARPQEQQDDSLAAAARRTQEKKAQQADSTKPAKVWDNDNLPDKPGAINVIGPDQSAAPAGNNAANAPADANPASPEDKSGIQGDLLSSKARLEELKADLDVMQRKYAMDQSTYYGKTNYAADKSATAALASEKADVDAKLEEVAKAQKQMAELQSKLDAASKDKSAAAK